MDKRMFLESVFTKDFLIKAVLLLLALHLLLLFFRPLEIHIIHKGDGIAGYIKHSISADVGHYEVTTGSTEGKSYKLKKPLALDCYKKP